MAIYPLSLWIGFFEFSGNDWDLLILKSVQKKELPGSVTRFGLLPIEIPCIKNILIFISSFVKKKFLTCYGTLGVSDPKKYSTPSRARTIPDGDY
jgi:hypothetical protein